MYPHEGSYTHTEKTDARLMAVSFWHVVARLGAPHRAWLLSGHVGSHRGQSGEKSRPLFGVPTAMRERHIERGCSHIHARRSRRGQTALWLARTRTPITAQPQGSTRIKRPPRRGGPEGQDRRASERAAGYAHDATSLRGAPVSLPHLLLGLSGPARRRDSRTATWILWIYPLNLSISLSGGMASNRACPSNGE